MELTKKYKIIGIVLAFLLLLTIINSTGFFLGKLKVSLLEWIVFNACAPSSLAYLIGLVLFFTTRNKIWLTIAAVPIFFFGTMGLFIFPWGGFNLIAQVSHILMTLNLIWAFTVVFMFLDYKALGSGLFVSLILFIPFITYQQMYCRSHAEDLMRILQIQ